MYLLKNKYSKNVFSEGAGTDKSAGALCALIIAMNSEAINSSASSAESWVTGTYGPR